MTPAPETISAVRIATIDPDDVLRGFADAEQAAHAGEQRRSGNRQHQPGVVVTRDFNQTSRSVEAQDGVAAGRHREVVAAVLAFGSHDARPTTRPGG